MAWCGIRKEEMRNQPDSVRSPTLPFLSPTKWPHSSCVRLCHSLTCTALHALRLCRLLLPVRLPRRYRIQLLARCLVHDQNAHSSTNGTPQASSRIIPRSCFGTRLQSGLEDMRAAFSTNLPETKHQVLKQVLARRLDFNAPLIPHLRPVGAFILVSPPSSRSGSAGFPLIY